MEKTCDLLVLGGGGGGLTAAVRAKALNPALQVLILEKADFLGGGIGGMGIICAKTIEELAEKMGVPADTLAETIRHYNECCEKGFDDEYFKKPPKNANPQPCTLAGLGALFASYLLFLPRYSSLTCWLSASSWPVPDRAMVPVSMT